MLPLIGHAAAFVESLHQYKEALHLYTSYVRLPLLRAVGLETAPTFAVDVAVLWLALFAAVNAFILSADGMFLWGHIGHHYCLRTKQTRLARVLCRLPKYLWAFLLTPLVCFLAAIASLMSGRTYITLAYVTVHTTTVAKFLAALFAISTLVLAGLALVPSLISHPA